MEEQGEKTRRKQKRKVRQGCINSFGQPAWVQRTWLRAETDQLVGPNHSGGGVCGWGVRMGQGG